MVFKSSLRGNTVNSLNGETGDVTLTSSGGTVTITTPTSTTINLESNAGTVTTTGSPASGNLTKFSGASSITNGDLSGDITTSGTLVATIANLAVTTAKINTSAVTYAKIQNESAATLLGNPTGGAAAPSEITLGTGLSFAGTVLNASAGTGTVSTVSVATANGFAGSVANPTTTPAITVQTTVTGLLKGNGTAVSAALAGTDYGVPWVDNWATARCGAV